MSSKSYFLTTLSLLLRASMCYLIVNEQGKKNPQGISCFFYSLLSRTKKFRLRKKLTFKMTFPSKATGFAWPGTSGRGNGF